MFIQIGLDNSSQYNYFHVILLKKQARYNPIQSTLSSYVGNILNIELIFIPIFIFYFLTLF